MTRTSADVLADSLQTQYRDNAELIAEVRRQVIHSPEVQGR